MRRFLKIIINAILAFGWTWTVFAKDSGLVNDTQRLVILCVLLTIFLGKETAALIEKPASKAEVATRRDVIEGFLGTVLANYYVELNLPGQAGLPAIRINVALLTRVGFMRNRMMITYTTSAKNGYSSEELQMQFAKGDAVIGIAWESGKPAFFPIRGGRPLPVTEDKVPLVKHIQSVLSIPLELEDKVVGVLSMDSEFPIETTGFGQDNIIKFAQAAAKKLEPLCFASGVKRV
jgi:hypothetical protein